jgi:nucleoside-diphosphate-sugar epimerase
MKRAIIFGSAGFIGSHLCARLKAEGYWVRGVDRKQPAEDRVDEFILGDLREPDFVNQVIDGGFDELYQLAADMGGAGYIFSGENDARLIHDSAVINLNTAETACRKGVGKVFFSSSACIYPKHHQQNPSAPCCSEDTAYPADPDSEYGWEKLFSERMYLAFQRNHDLDVRIARLHNVYGPGNSWCDGREKAPAALCRKVAQATDGGTVEIWGDGKQTRSFLYVDDCLDGIRALMESRSPGPLNIGSEEMIRLNDLAALIIRIANRKLTIRNVPGPVGVRGRTSDNRLMFQATGWRPKVSLEDGISRTYRWVARQVYAAARGAQGDPAIRSSECST